jgi:hypothetical protein
MGFSLSQWGVALLSRLAATDADHPGQMAGV